MPNNAQRDYGFLKLVAEEIAYKLAHGEIDEADAAQHITNTAYHYAQKQKRPHSGRRSNMRS